MKATGAHGRLHLDNAEHARLFDHAAPPTDRSHAPALRPPAGPPAVQHILDAITGAAVFVRNERLDILGGNRLGYAQHD